MRQRETITILVGDDDEEVEIPSRFEVCDRCAGRGTHVNPNIDGHGITADEWWGPDWDDESREMYLSGGYDVTCQECDGARVVLVPDLERLEREDPELLKQYLTYARSIADLRRDEAFERKYGC